jgi:hypothetical protein
VPPYRQGGRGMKRGLFRETCWESGWLKGDVWADEPVERKLTKKELSEAYRLWVVHADIREGRVEA